jgi:hypothetical protein
MGYVNTEKQTRDPMSVHSVSPGGTKRDEKGRNRRKERIQRNGTPKKTLKGE